LADSNPGNLQEPPDPPCAVGNNTAVSKVLVALKPAVSELTIVALGFAMLVVIGASVLGRPLCSPANSQEPFDLLVGASAVAAMAVPPLASVGFVEFEFAVVITFGVLADPTAGGWLWKGNGVFVILVGFTPP
jgi:hypothetical protein